jgi:carbon-monoxide dehydrogenase medium subunit
MSVLPPFELHRPDTIEEVVQLVSWDDLPYVGGTELLLAMRAGLLNPRSLIDLKGVGELTEIGNLNGSIRIGAAVTHQRAATDESVSARLPELPPVLLHVGNPRVRWSGTLAGNLCFAEPKSDVIPFLIALDATVTLASTDGSREMSVREFIVGPYFTARTEHELLTWIDIPVVPGRRGTYLKYQVMERPTVGVAAVRFDEDGSTVTRVVVGAAGELPVVHEVDHADPNRSLVAAAVVDQLKPIDDLTGSAEYKRHVTAVYVERALERLERM